VFFYAGMKVKQQSPYFTLYPLRYNTLSGIKNPRLSPGVVTLFWRGGDLLAFVLGAEIVVLAAIKTAYILCCTLDNSACELTALFLFHPCIRQQIFYCMGLL
jgi:hypothetical protein